MRTILTLAVSALCLSACSSSEESSTPGNDSGVDTFVVDSGVADVEPETDAGPPLHAFVSFERWSRANPLGLETYTMIGIPIFHAGAGAPPPNWGRIDEHCAMHEGKSADALPDFGTITLKGTALGDITFETSAGYNTPPAREPGWKPGDVITLVAEGAGLPGWEITETFPEAATFISPDITKLAARELTIARDRSLDLQWTPTSGEVFALVLQFDADIYQIRGIHCFFHGADGAGSIPVAALSRLLPSASVYGTNLYLNGSVSKTLALAGVDVEVVFWNGNSQRVLVE